MAYSDKVIEHYENPKNVGTLDKEDPNVGTGLVGAPACGDVMRLQLKISDEGVIQDAKFKTFGCGSAIASSSLVTEWVKGKTIDEARHDHQQGDRQGALAAAGEDPLLGARRRRDQGGDRGLQEEARRPARAMRAAAREQVMTHVRPQRPPPPRKPMGKGVGSADSRRRSAEEAARRAADALTRACASR